MVQQLAERVHPYTLSKSWDKVKKWAIKHDRVHAAILTLEQAWKAAKKVAKAEDKASKRKLKRARKVAPANGSDEAPPPKRRPRGG